MDDNKKRVVEYKLPDDILKLTEGTIEYPSVIETDFYIKEALDIILSKNKIVWSVKYFNGSSIDIKEGLVKFDNSNTYLYFIKRVDETTYKFYAIIPEDSSDSMIYYLNSLKKYKTI